MSEGEQNITPKQERQSQASLEKALANQGYEMGTQLGWGDIARVYALSPLFPENPPAVAKVLENPLDKSDLKCLESERNILINVDSPFIPRYLGFFKSGSPPYTVLLETKAPGEEIGNCNPTFKERLIIISQMAQFIQSLHKSGLHHPDFKADFFWDKETQQITVVDLNVMPPFENETKERKDDIIGMGWLLMRLVKKNIGLKKLADLGTLRQNPSLYELKKSIGGNQEWEKLNGWQKAFIELCMSRDGYQQAGEIVEDLNLVLSGKPKEIQKHVKKLVNEGSVLRAKVVLHAFVELNPNQKNVLQPTIEEISAVEQKALVTLDKILEAINKDDYSGAKMLAEELFKRKRTLRSLRTAKLIDWAEGLGRKRRLPFYIKNSLGKIIEGFHSAQLTPAFIQQVKELHQATQNSTSDEAQKLLTDILLDISIENRMSGNKKENLENALRAFDKLSRNYRANLLTCEDGYTLPLFPLIQILVEEDKSQRKHPPLVNENRKDERTEIEREVEKILMYFGASAGAYAIKFLRALEPFKDLVSFIGNEEVPTSKSVEKFIDKYGDLFGKQAYNLYGRLCGLWYAIDRYQKRILDDPSEGTKLLEKWETTT